MHVMQYINHVVKIMGAFMLLCLFLSECIMFIDTVLVEPISSKLRHSCMHFIYVQLIAMQEHACMLFQ